MIDVTLRADLIGTTQNGVQDFVQSEPHPGEEILRQHQKYYAALAGLLGILQGLEPDYQQRAMHELRKHFGPGDKG